MQGEKFFIGIVGDSWVAGGKLDQGIWKALYDAKVDAIVKSRGYPGAAMDTIAAALIDGPRALLPYVRKNYPDRRAVILIEGGLNDVIGYRGVTGYVEAVRRMVAATTAAGATPIVLTIPLFLRETVRRGALAGLRRLLRGNPLSDTPDTYNAALEAKIGRTVVIDLMGLSLLEPRDDTGAHLPATGFDRLAERIGERLVAAVSRVEQVAHGAP